MESKTFSEVGFDTSLHIDLPYAKNTSWADIVMIGPECKTVFMSVFDREDGEICCNAKHFRNIDISINYQQEFHLLTIEDMITKEWQKHAFDLSERRWKKIEEGEKND